MRAQIKQTFGLVMMMMIILITCGCTKKEPQEDTTEIQLDNTETYTQKENDDIKTDEKPETERIYVYVCGQVINPGVYELKNGSRIYEAIDAAGGLTDKAAPELLNQAEKADDGQKIYVPSQEERETGSLMQGNMSEEDGKVNINTADSTQLMTLPGIGEAKAQKIIKYRDEQGGFQKPEELMNIPGIKEGVYESIKDLIKV